MAKDAVTDNATIDIGKVAKELERFQNLRILVGWQDTGNTDLSVIDIATFQEFGTSTIPARPALSTAMDINQKEIGEAFEREIGKILDGKQKALQAAERLGIFAVTLVKKRIQDSPNWAKELAESTKKLKGSDVPLIDIGEMLNSVTYVVDEKGTVVASG